ncbi:protoporphyrinogen oxidase [Thalassobacillus sp. CUG 92003]|uniref:protoporphyrinogen oxidase n=1 Tax=Thalassobacillus sp. CUG 92003 TaxID=2736641 RepID=UPI0015E646A6|nr:protoporphyrinogen oxidase [Thalassobacillus sp. CUG 92003]
MEQTKHVVVIGGGIAGLTAAYRLQRDIDQNELPMRVKLIEASEQLGGKIQTVHKDGFTIERGPDSFLERKESAMRLARDVGLGDQLIPNGTGQAYILVNNKLHPMPKGSFMGVPTRVRPFLFSGLFSPIGKLRASMDLIKGKSKQAEDQSLGLFFRRRLGDQFVENLIEPLLSGIYAGDIDNLSLMATFPNFYELEQKHGSLIKGLKKTRPKADISKQAKKPSMFRTLEHGLETLVEAVANKLHPGTVSTGVSVDHIEKKEHAYHLLLSNGEVEQADAVVIAAPFFQAERMLSQYEFLRPFRDMPATSVANVAMAFDASAIKEDVDGTGFVVSRNSNFRITACTWTHKKWPHTTPDGKVLLRCYVGKPDDQAIVNYSDEEIVNIALNDLNQTMTITGDPEFSIITRWNEAMPQYTVGHKQRITDIENQMREELPGVYLAGGSYRGIGLPDCIDQGEQAATEVLDYLT